MALLARYQRIRLGRGGDLFPSRWPLAAVFLLVAALIGVSSAVLIGNNAPGNIQSADKTPEKTHLSAREPLRAIVTAERRDGTQSHWQSADGAILPNGMEIVFPFNRKSSVAKFGKDPVLAARRTSALPRAPPVLI